MIKILIGCLPPYGGVKQHMENIHNFSKYKPDIFGESNFSIKCMLNEITRKTSIYKPMGKTKEGSKSSFNIVLFENLVDPLGIFLSKVVFPSKYDIIHLHGHPYWSDAYLTTKNAKYIYTVHQIYLKEDFRNLKRWEMRSFLNKKMFKLCKEAEIVISVAMWQQNLLTKESIDSIYIPNGVDMQKCTLGNAKRFREKYEIYKDFFLFGGDLRWYKRPELFINLAKRMPDKLFIMKGKDVTKDRISNMGSKVPKNLVCLGLLPYEDLFDLYAASRVLVHTSKNDTFPTVLLEAMSLKKVIVASDSAGPGEMVTHEKDGFLFRPDNIEDLERKAVMAWENPELGKNGYRKVKEKFDWNVVIKKIDKAYELLKQV